MGRPYKFSIYPNAELRALLAKTFDVSASCTIHYLAKRVDTHQSEHDLSAAHITTGA